MRRIDRAFFALVRWAPDRVRRAADASPMMRRLSRVLLVMDGDEDERWITTENGAHIRINEEGEVTGGPKEMQGKPLRKPGGRGRMKKPPRLAHKETAKITSEINTYFHAKYSDPDMIHVHRTFFHGVAYDYFFISNGFNEYVFVDKRRNEG